MSGIIVEDLHALADRILAGEITTEEAQRAIDLLETEGDDP